jgi:2,3-bisphosphoglycerate-independent phosphoglycerate mutase
MTTQRTTRRGERFRHAISTSDTPPSPRKPSNPLKTRAHLATVIGRYFTMDRDKRWERVQRGYDLMTLGAGTETKDPLETLRRFYEQGVTDEFMEPISVLTPEGAHLGRVEDGDALIFFNFRADRMRQIVTAFKDAEFDGFPRAVHPKAKLVTMNRYHEVRLAGAYPPRKCGTISRRFCRRQASGVAHRGNGEYARHVLVTADRTRCSPAKTILVPSPKVATYSKTGDVVFEVTTKWSRRSIEVRRDHHEHRQPCMVGHGLWTRPSRPCAIPTSRSGASSTRSRKSTASRSSPRTTATPS